MDLEAVSGAATVALASTIVFLAVAKGWIAVARNFGRTSSFSDRILNEAAHRFRDEFERLTGARSAYLSSTLAFVLLFVAAYALKARELFVNYPVWQLYLQLAFLSLAAAFAGYRIVKTVIALRKIRFLRDANIAIGHQLRQLSATSSRVYHDVKTSAGTVDHVIAGPSGLYAINVFARRPAKDGDAKISGNTLDFSNTDELQDIVDLIAKSRRFEKEMRELVGHAIRVRSVIAVPGWDIAEQSGDHLLVNERTIGIINGWKDAEDHLMNEDIDAIQEELTARCRAA